MFFCLNSHHSAGAVSCLKFVGMGLGLHWRVVAGALSQAEETLRPILHRTMWSLGIAYQGMIPRPYVGPGGCEEPSQRLAGTRLARAFAVTEHKGDWEHHVSLWGLRRFWRSGMICHCCSAARIRSFGIPFTHFGNQWARTSTVNFLLHVLPDSPVPLILIPGWHPAQLSLSLSSIVCVYAASANACACMYMHVSVPGPAQEILRNAHSQLGHISNISG